MIEDLVETRWRIRAVRSGSEVVATIEERGEPEFVFLGDGRFAGSTGCNRFFGQFEERADGSIATGPIGSTMMMCPEDLMVQERHILAALEATAAVERSERGLRFVDGTGVVVLELTLFED